MDEWTPAVPSNGWMNRLIKRIRSTLHLDVSPDFDLEHTPAGRSISLRREPPFWARLTAGTSPGPFSFRRVLLKRDGTWADVVARADRAIAYYGGTGPGADVGRRVLMRDVGLGKEYRFFLPRRGPTGDGCAEVRISALIVGCGCKIPGVKARLYLGAVQIGTEQTTGTAGSVSWSSTDIPELVFSEGYSIVVEPPAIYQGQTVVLGTIPCIHSEGITLAPADGYMCSVCCPGVPIARNLTVNGDPATANDIGTVLSATDTIDPPCTTWNGSTDVPSSTITWRLDRACNIWIVVISGYLEWTVEPALEGGGFGPSEFRSRTCAIMEGVALGAFDCLLPTDVSLDFPGDFFLQWGGFFSEGYLLDFLYFSASAGLTWPYERVEIAANGDRHTFAFHGGPATGTTWHILEADPVLDRPTVLPGTVTTGQLCVRAVAAGCTAFESGPVIAGLSAEIINASTAGSVASGTTDADGKFCATVDLGKTYDLKVTSGDCVSTRRVYLPGSCEAVPAPAAYDVIVCCAVVCIDVSGHFADDADDADPTALQDSQVTGPDGVVRTTDSSGRVCLNLTTDQMQNLAAVEGDCATRLLPLVILGPGSTSTSDGPWLRRCATVPVPCGQTEEGAAASPTAVTLYGLKRNDGSDAYNRLPAALATTCPPPNCANEGWSGLIPVSEDVQTDHDTYAWDDGTSSGTYSLLGGLAGATTRLNLDTERFDGLTPTTWSPFDPAKPPQRVEHVATHSASFTTRDGTTFGAGGHLWLCGNELIVSFTKSGFDPTAEGVEVLNVPSALVEGSGVGTASAIFLHYKPLDFDVCDLTSGATSATQTAAVGDYPRDWTIRWTRGVLPP
jgi:hypothetical protein